MIGTPNIMAKVSRSRRELAHLLGHDGAEPAQEAHRDVLRPSSALSRALPMRWMKTSSSVGSASSHLIAGSARQGAIAASSSASRSGPQTCSVAPKAAAAVTPGASRSCAASRSAPGPAATKAIEARLP